MKPIDLRCPPKLRFGLLVIVTAAALGCATTSADPRDTAVIKAEPTITLSAPVSSEVEDLEKAGKWTEAAAEYARMAEGTLPPAQIEFRLKSAQLYFKGNDIADAKAMLGLVASTPMSPEMAVAFNIVHARISLLERDGDAALRWLNRLNLSERSQLGEDFLRMFIIASEYAENYLDAAVARVDLEYKLQDNAEIEFNQQQILQDLTKLPQTDLTQVAQTHSLSAVRGWAELSLLVAQNKDPFRLSSALDGWKNKYSNHPITAATLRALTPQKSDAPPVVEQVALLLPFDGPYHKAATAVRDGFLTTFYSTQVFGKKPIIKIYGTGANDENVLAVYQKAIEEGANVVVGPLNKNGIEQLVAKGDLPVPTLALNQLEDSRTFTENLYQFGLAPEDEARQVAQRMWNDGHTRIALLYPEGTWGERVITAFKTQWLALGGEIIIAQVYSAEKANLSDPIKNLLAIDKSEKRHKDLNLLLRDSLKDSLKFEARRRHDIDGIFMAAFPRQARLIPPLMEFHSAGDLPIYATSHAFTGAIDKQADRDLNEVVIGDMPWTITDFDNSPIKQTVVKLWPDDARQLSRLYALGVDAYQVLYYLNWLRGNANARLPGATGLLRIDNNNRIQRELTWANFSQGRPRLVTGVLKGSRVSPQPDNE